MNLENKILIDISPTISSKTAVFPGDTPFEHNFLLKMDMGNNLDLSSIKTSVHIGAHTDAPCHYNSNGESIDKRALNYYLGPVQVIEVDCPRSTRILPQHLTQNIKAPRILFKTNSFPDPDQWNADFVALSAELVDFLALKKVVLVGIDTPSIDPAEDKNLESHNAVFKNNMAILEGIVLKDVQSGLYDLICLPLKIAGADASPVRAILIK